MKKSMFGYCIGAWSSALALVAGCGTDASQPSANAAGSGNGASAGTANHAGSNGGSSGTSASLGGTGGSSAGSGGVSPATSGSGGSAAGSSGSGAAGSVGMGGAGGINGGSGGSSGASSGGAPPVGVARTVELIGPGPNTCGATNATHGDGFVCVLNYPAEGPNVIGYWFDYAFTAGTCNLAMTKPTGNQDANPKVCFSGSACPATSGGGLGVALCDVHGIDVSTWPQLAMLETSSTLSTTVKSPLAGCNPGATLAGVSWTLASGSLPAGMSLLFDDAADKTLGRVDNVPAGATSVSVPATVDSSKVASIKFSATGASSASWNFCLSRVKLSLL